MNKSRRCQGYTLIELLVSLTIIGLIFGLGYFGFREFSRRQLVLGTARALKANLRLAQEQALAGKKPDGCLEPLDGYEFNLVDIDQYQVQAICGSDRILVKEVSLPPEVEVSVRGINPILFKPIGAGNNIPLGTDVEFEIVHTVIGFSSLVMVSSGGEIE